MIRRTSAAEAARELLARRRKHDMRVLFVRPSGTYNGRTLAPGTDGRLVHAYDGAIDGTPCASVTRRGA